MKKYAIPLLICLAVFCSAASAQQAAPDPDPDPAPVNSPWSPTGTQAVPQPTANQGQPVTPATSTTGGGVKNALQGMGRGAGRLWKWAVTPTGWSGGSYPVQPSMQPLQFGQSSMQPMQFSQPMTTSYGGYNTNAYSALGPYPSQPAMQPLRFNQPMAPQIPAPMPAYIPTSPNPIYSPVYSPGGMVQAIPNPGGGMNFMGPGGMVQTIPNAGGGMNIYYPNGSTAQTIAAPGGGWNTFGPYGR